jgi:hypothetical protein
MSRTCRYPAIVSVIITSSEKYRYCKLITGQTPFELSAKITLINALQNLWYLQHIRSFELLKKVVISKDICKIAKVVILSETVEKGILG